MCHLEDIITMRHIDKVAKLTLVSGLIIDYIYAMEFFIAWYSGDPYERWVFGHRLFGHTYWFGGWMLIGINVCVTQLLWFKKVRSNLVLLFVIGVLINIGMWSERFVIVVGSLVPGFPAGELGQVHADDVGHRHFTSARSARFSCCICCS
jgi:hypothetical protein